MKQVEQQPWYRCYSSERGGSAVLESRRSDQAVAQQDARLLHFVSGRKTWVETEGRPTAENAP